MNNRNGADRAAASDARRGANGAPLDNGHAGEEVWRAIVGNDAAYDERFVYAVASTGIFCRPSCKSRPPKRENVRIYSSPEQALADRFRPCKRCKPTGETVPDHEWADQIAQYIETNYKETMTLEALAEACHGSPYHLQRTFKRIKGMAPVEYVQQTRMAKAKEQLLGSDRAIADIAHAVGMPNASYFITLFKTKTGYTPNEYRHAFKIAMEVSRNGSGK